MITLDDFMVDYHAEDEEVIVDASALAEQLRILAVYRESCEKKDKELAMKKREVDALKNENVALQIKASRGLLKVDLRA